MTVKILYKNNDDSNNQVLFVEENYNLNNIKKYVSRTDLSYIKEIMVFYSHKTRIIFPYSIKVYI